MIQRLNMRPDVGMWCVDYDGMDNEFAISKSEICNSSYIVRGMLEYSCLRFDLNILPDPLDRCRVELSIYGCVQASLTSSGVMCDIDNIRQVVRRDEVRRGLLDSIPRNCQASLPDSTCAQDFYIHTEAQANDCITALFALTSLPMFTDVDSLPSSNSSNKNLKCSLYEEAISCYIVKTNVTETCPASEVALGLQRSMVIYVTVVNATSGPSTPRLGLSFTECDAYCPPHEDLDGLVGVCAPACSNDTDCSSGQICCFQSCGLNCVDPLTSLPKSFPDKGCPSSPQVVDRVVALCSGYVLPGIRWFGMEPCQNYASFNECLSRIQLPAECQDDHLWESLGEYSSYIASVIDGFDPIECKIASQCRDIDYVKAVLLPHCQNETDMFLKYIWETGCQHFDELIFCVAQGMESKQLYCHLNDIKEMIAGYTKEITNYDWDYTENCERSQWVAELRFQNETFVQEMYDNASTSYRNFVQKYSHLISAVLERFSGGRIKYVYEGSVVLGVSFWTIQHPEEQIWMLLCSQFGADLDNITVGNVYKDSDQNRCLDSIYVKDIATGRCGELLVAMETRADNCAAFTDLLNCVRRSLAMEAVLCGHETIVQQLAGRNPGAANFTLLPQDFDLEYCKSLKCSVWFIEMVQHEDCSKSYMKMNITEGEKCRHYQEFLGCIKYQGLINDEECHVADLDEMVQEMSRRTDLETCVSHEELEAMFPDTKSEICNSSSVVRHLLEYQCMEFDLDVLNEPLDHCRFELSLYGCVQEILGRDAGCSMADVEQIMTQDEVRRGLLDSVSPDYCDANLLDSQCERDFYTVILTKGENCFQSLVSLYYFAGVLHDRSGSGGGKLKCSLYVEALRCFLAVDDFNETCSPLDIAPALKHAMKMYEQILPTLASDVPVGNFTWLNISFSECDTEVPEEFPARSCPPSSVLADAVVATCSGTVLYATRYYQLQPCMAYPEFNNCMQEILLSQQQSCDFDLSTIEEYESYISEATDGFSLQNCKYAANCSALLSQPSIGETTSVDMKCFTSLSYIIFVPVANMSQYELCIAYQTFLLEAEDCLLNTLPSYCEGAVDGIIQQRLYYLTSAGFNDSACADIPADPCSPIVLGIQGLLKCSGVFTDGVMTDDTAPPHCRFRSCFHALGPPDCGYSDTQLDMYASQTFQRISGFPLAECPGGSYDTNCSALLRKPAVTDNHTEPQSIEDKCFGPLYYIFFVNPENITQEQTCLILKSSLPDVEYCLSSSLPDNCSSSVKGFIEERLNYLALMGFDRDSCEDVPEDPCSVTVLGIRSLMKCYQIFMNSSSVGDRNSLPPNCRYRSCFRSIVPRDCHFSDTDIEMYAGSTFQNFTGFLLPECPDSFVGNCSALVSRPPVRDNTTEPLGPHDSQTLDEKCFNPLFELIHLTTMINITQTEKCTVFLGLWSEAESCLSDSLPNYCQNSVNVLIQQKLYSFSTDGFDVAQFSQCHETEVDLCSAFDVQGLVKCFHVFGYNTVDDNLPFHCRFRSCFNEAAPRECSFSNQEIHRFASSSFQRLLGDIPLPECTDTKRCMAKVSRSIYDCAKPLYQVSDLLRFRDTYPNSRFEYGIDEGCGILKMASTCLKEQFPADDDYCQSLTWSIYEDIYVEGHPDWIFNYTIDQCPDEETLNECQSAELFIMLQCHRELQYSCNFHRCVADNLPKFAHCNNSTAGQDAATLYHRFTGSDMPSCYGLTVPCDLSDCSDVRYATCVNNYCQCADFFQEEDHAAGRYPVCIREI